MRAAEVTQFYKEKAQIADEYLARKNYDSCQKNGQRYARNRNVKQTSPADQRGVKYREVFIGKLPRDLFEDELVPMLELAGRVELIRLMMDFSGTNRGYAFALYQTKDEAVRAVRLFNGVHIRAEDEQPIGVVLSFDNRALTLGNLPLEIEEKKLRQELDRIINGIESIKLPDCPPDAASRIASITFITHEAATQARRVLCPGDITICDRLLTVDWAKPDKPILDENDINRKATATAASHQVPPRAVSQQAPPRAISQPQQRGRPSAAAAPAQSRGQGVARRAPIMPMRPHNNQLHHHHQQQQRPQNQLPQPPQNQLQQHHHRNMNNAGRQSWVPPPANRNHHHLNHNHASGPRRSPSSSSSSSTTTATATATTSRRTPPNRVVGQPAPQPQPPQPRPTIVPVPAVVDTNNNISNNNVQLMDSLLESFAAPFVPVLAPSPSPSSCILGEKAREMLAACPADPLCTTIVKNINLTLLDQTRLFNLFQLNNHFKVTRIQQLPPSTLEVTYAQPDEAKFVTDLLRFFPGKFERLAMPGTQIVAHQVQLLSPLPPTSGDLYPNNHHLPSLYNLQGILSH